MSEKVAPARLAALVRDVFARQGMSAEHAALVADALVWAEMRGMDTHGVMRAPRYVELIRRGDLNPRPVIKATLETPAAVVLECDRAAGAVAMMQAVRAACDKARNAGVGVALARATTHTGALGYYTQHAARDGFAAVALVASIPLMAYHGTRAASVGTAPLSIAVPGEDEPLALDMASSLISMGALMRARATGAPIAEGAALAADGTPTADSRRAAIPLPLGGPKGSGLALMSECLASLLTGNPILAEALEGRGRHKQNGLVIALDVQRFLPLADFRREVRRLSAALRKLPADGEILMPGERGARNAARSREALEIDADVYAELQALNSDPGS
ncbi:MAG TPA: Ldh family oxidoreductase [Burkholderiales bacterium]|nr:Ldh family oxidoreductase [Burkholderiales bacterium]